MIAMTKGPTMGKTVTQAVLVSRGELNSDQIAIDLAIFNPDGSPFSPQDSSEASQTPKLTVAGLIATAEKTCASPEPAIGSLVALKFTNGNSAGSPTVAFSGAAATPVLLGGTAPISGEITIGAQGVALFFYDGTSLHQIGVYT